MRKKFELVPFASTGGKAIFSTNRLWLAKAARFYILAFTGRLYYLLDTSQHHSLREAYLDFGHKDRMRGAPSDE
ncbi:MAG TPA: hypothetical protein VM659_14065 [Dongiaceae bacterium]|nr:hypothetical protein [Dongiaceae bacterium]